MRAKKATKQDIKQSKIANKQLEKAKQAEKNASISSQTISPFNPVSIKPPVLS